MVSGLTENREVLGMVAQGAGMALSLLGHQRQGLQVLMSALEPEPPKDPATVLALTSMLHAVAFQSGVPEARRPLVALADLIGTCAGDTTCTERKTTSAVDAVRAGTLAGADPTKAAELLRQRMSRWPTAHGSSAQAGDTLLMLAMGGLAWYADESEHCVEVLPARLRRAHRVRLRGHHQGLAGRAGLGADGLRTVGGDRGAAGRGRDPGGRLQTETHRDRRRGAPGNPGCPARPPSGRADRRRPYTSSKRCGRRRDRGRRPV